MQNLHLTSFLGINFGASQELAKEKMLSRPGCTLMENSSSENLFFEGVTFAGRNTDLILLLFIDDKFSKAAVYIKPKLETQTVTLYREIKQELNSKYFKTAEDYEIYDNPYEENDGDTETGISVGKINFSSFWTFQDAKGGLEDFISLKITEDHEIVISYEDGDLIDELVTRKKADDSEDY